MAHILSLLIGFLLAATEVRLESVGNGDVKLAFLAPIMKKNAEGICEEVCVEGLNLAEIAVYATQKVNNEILNGTGVTMALEVMDTCPGSSKILTSLMLPMATESECPIKNRHFQVPKRTGPVLGLVGLENAPDIGDFYTFSTSFNVPIVSYAANQPELTDKRPIPFLFRSQPSDVKLYEAMGRQISEMNPEGLGILFEESPYGREGKKTLEKQLNDKGVKYVEFVSFPAKPTMEDILEAVGKLQGDKTLSLHAFVICEKSVATVMAALNSLPAEDLKPIIGNAEFAKYLNITNAQRFENMVVVRHASRRLPGLHSFYQDLCSKGGNTPWWHRFWGQDSLNDCMRALPEGPKYNFAVNAIYAFGHTLKEFIENSCSASDKSACAQYLQQCWARASLMSHLKAVEFTPFGGDEDHPFKFDENQDAEPQFEMVQLKVRSSIVRWDLPFTY